MKGVKTENTSDFSINSELSTSELEISQDEICEEIIINKDNKVSLIINSISSILEKLIKNKKQKKKDSNLKELVKPFESKIIPDLSINDYLKRIIKYTNCEINSLIFSLIYLDRICLKNIDLSPFNIHKFLFATILLAIKTNEDNIYRNSYYSQIAGVTLKELNLMEYNLCIILNYNFFVNESTFNVYKKALKINLPYL
jgi:hypothetical protein